MNRLQVGAHARWGNRGGGRGARVRAGARPGVEAASHTGSPLGPRLAHALPAQNLFASSPTHHFPPTTLLLRVLWTAAPPDATRSAHKRAAPHAYMPTHAPLSSSPHICDLITSFST